MPKKRKKKVGKLQAYDIKTKQKSPFEKALTPLNVSLFLIMAVLVALAIIEPSRVLDFVAGLGFIIVLLKIMYDGYR